MGMMWRGGYQAFHHFASLVGKLILVRFLLPADFGLLAMAMVVFNSLDILNRFAGGEPFIRDTTTDPYMAKNTLFFTNLVFLGTTALLGFCSAPYIALFFSKKIANNQSVITLIWIIRIFSLRLFFSVFAAVPLATLTKELRFKELYIGNIAGTSSYFVVAPILAFLDFGVWAIVIAHIVEQVVTTTIFLIYSPFFPSLSFDKNTAKSYVKYNSNIFVISIVMIVITEGDDTIIGRLMGPAILGFYNIGQQFAMLATNVISTNINNIIFPVLSQLQGDREMYTKAVFKSFRIMTMSAFPFIGGSVILAKEIVRCFFGETWLPVVPVFYILSIATLFTSVVSIARPVLMSLNKPHLFRNSQLIGLAFFLGLAYPFAKAWGSSGVCWVMVILPITAVFYLTPKIANEVNQFYHHMFSTLTKVFACTLIMVTGVYFLKIILPTSIISLIMCVVAGIVIYVTTMLFCDKDLKNELHEGFIILKEKVSYTNA